MAEVIKPERDELIQQASQGEVLHNDDTGMRVLKLEREPGDQRTGVFTSGMVSTAQGRKIALYFTGRQHAGENLADVLKQRPEAAGPAIQMSDGLSWNAPKLPGGVELLVAHCLAHGRRQIVEVAQNFPVECRYVLEQLGEVYGVDALTLAGPGGARRRHDGGGAAALPSAAQRADHGDTAGWKRSSPSEGGAQFGPGEGDHVPAAALEGVESIFAAGRRPSGQ
jgi:hypothetical protein